MTTTIRFRSYVPVGEPIEIIYQGRKLSEMTEEEFEAFMSRVEHIAFPEEK